MSSIRSSLLLNGKKLLFRRSLGSVRTRNYLTPAYQSIDNWNRRFDNKLVQMVDKPDRFFILLDQQWKKKLRLFAFDLDLYIQSLGGDEDKWDIVDLEYIIKEFGSSNERWSVLESTAHTLLRILLMGDQNEAIIRIISQPEIYAMFPDEHVANFLMDKFLEEGNFTYAARVAVQLMLTESFGRPLNQYFVLLSCLKWVQNQEQNQEWVDYSPKVEEPEEDVYKRVEYLTNPYFDDNFHLKEPELLVGKTLARCSELCLSASVVKDNCRLLGWILFRKWGRLSALLDDLKIRGDSSVISSDTMKLAKERVSQYCEDEQLKVKLLATLDQIKTDESLNIATFVENVLKQRIVEDEKNEVEILDQLYTKFDADRERESARLDALSREVKIKEEIRKKKKHLKKMDELLYFFEREKQIDVTMQQRKENRIPEAFQRWGLMKRNRKRKSENVIYVPPTLR